MSTHVKAMCGALVDERTGYMLGTPEGRAQLSAYLDVLDRTHADDKWMRAYVKRTRAKLAATEAVGT